MKLSGWGNFPTLDGQAEFPGSRAEIARCLSAPDPEPVIARGCGRSYGDSSLAARVIQTDYLDHFLGFDPETGILTCSGGTGLSDILSVFVPKGWFLSVTPGTKFVTVGGAIASDVHGKNHHVDGSFSDHVVGFDLMTADGRIHHCSTETNTELFRATCGGMGLTGVILQAQVKLRPVTSAYIDQTTIEAKNVEEALAIFEAQTDQPYSVAWIDCLSTGDSLGRSLVMVGTHAAGVGGAADFPAPKPGGLSVPVTMPSWLLNGLSVQAFNFLYYHKKRAAAGIEKVYYEPYFYPLDGIQQWNRIYGANGFTQYQFVLPKEHGVEGLTRILKRIAASKMGSFLAVLKAFGPGNDNYLSFPMEGYTLALDFKIQSGLLSMLDDLDALVLEYGGRLYLAKDARMTEATFKQSYRQWPEFAEIRKQVDPTGRFRSAQAARLGL